MLDAYEQRVYFGDFTCSTCLVGRVIFRSLILRKFVQSLPHPIANSLLFVRRIRNLYFKDGLATILNSDFQKDAKFSSAYQAAKSTGSFEKWEIPWRIHVLTWFANQVTHLPGDFVECGTDRGGTAMAVIDYVGWPLVDKSFYLLDTFSGLSAKTTEESEDAVAKFMDYDDSFEIAKKNFSNIPNVNLVRGLIPDTLSQVPSKAVCFLHIDLNSARPEVATLRHFWDKLTLGAYVVLDDYGWPLHIEQKKAIDILGCELGFQVLSLPTGQGIIQKT